MVTAFVFSDLIDGAMSQLTQTVVQAVDALHRRGRIEELRVGERSFGHVDQQAEPVRQVLVEGALQARSATHR